MQKLINKLKALRAKAAMWLDTKLYRRNFFRNGQTFTLKGVFFTHYYYPNFGCMKNNIYNRKSALKILRRKWRPATIRHAYMQDINAKFPE